MVLDLALLDPELLGLATLHVEELHFTALQKHDEVQDVLGTARQVHRHLTELEVHFASALPQLQLLVVGRFLLRIEPDAGDKLASVWQQQAVQD